VKLLLDTADPEDITEIDRWGVLDGVTTNPTLAAEAGRDSASMIEATRSS
jgi:transaldolase